MYFTCTSDVWADNSSSTLPSQVDGCKRHKEPRTLRACARPTQQLQAHASGESPRMPAVPRPRRTPAHYCRRYRAREANPLARYSRAQSRTSYHAGSHDRGHPGGLARTPGQAAPVGRLLAARFRRTPMKRSMPPRTARTTPGIRNRYGSANRSPPGGRVTAPRPISTAAITRRVEPSAIIDRLGVVNVSSSARPANPL